LIRVAENWKKVDLINEKSFTKTLF
jgi:hypothetical protein